MKVWQFAAGDAQADKVVPSTGFTAHLTLFAAGAMAFLAVFALALSLASGRLASLWGDELARTATIRIVAPADQRQQQTEAALQILQTTRGIASARALDDAEQAALLAPWFGSDLDVSSLPVPRLIEIIEEPQGFDADGLRLRLLSDVPGAALDDHARWREPLVKAAARLRLLGWMATVLIVLTIVAMVTLAARAALAANAQVIQVLRLVGATDRYIGQAFTRRFTLRAFLGAALGTFLGVLTITLIPTSAQGTGFLTGLGFEGWHWMVPGLVPFLSAGIAFVATGVAARHTLEGLA
ncbi:MAG: FtsX-like permease family protein [Sulfitobacter sp.]